MGQDPRLHMPVTSPLAALVAAAVEAGGLVDAAGG
jgi:hypothetical protein